MKKKIINGILMSALLLAGTTSFVSCKDNVDDEIAQVYKTIDTVKADLQLQIDGLSTRVSTLEGKVTALEGEVANLKNEVAQIKKDIDALDGRVKNLEEEQTKLQNRMKKAEDKLVDLEDRINNSIYDVKVEQTIDAVIGTIDLPFLEVPTLMSYYGLNASGITAFPTFAKSNKYHVYYYNGDGSVDENLVSGQYSSQIDPFMDNSVSPIRFEGLGAQLAQYANNVGTIYFSLNPVGVDLSNVTFDIVDSKGNVYPYEISDVKCSDHDLTFAAGKRGEKLNEGESTNQYLYQAKVHLPMAKWSQAISYNLDDTWKTLGKLGDIKSMVEKVKAANTEGGKTAASKVLVTEALQWFQNQYQKTYLDKYKMKYQALRATGKYNIAKSENKIVVAAVEPLSYKTFWELDQNGKAVVKKLVDVDAIEMAVAALVKASGKKVSEIAKIKPTGYQIETINGVNVDVADLTAAQIKAIVSNIPYANNVLAKLKQVYYASSNNDKAALQASASHFLEKVSAKIASIAGDNYFYNIVTPIVLFKGADEGDNSMHRLSPGLHIKTNGHKMNLILTSPTEEYLVPAMYKYIAVRHNDQIVDSKILSGQEKVVDVDLKYDGESEIIYQTVDYAGWVVTKSYPITVE